MPTPFFGNGAGSANTTGTFNVFVGASAGNTNTTGDNNTTIGYNTDVGAASLGFATAIGAGAIVSSSNTIQLGRGNGFDTVFAPGLIRVNGLGVAGATFVCRNASNQLSTCSSSLRYKSGVQTFTGGLDIVRRLRPITFSWKDGGMDDIGFGAEEVAKIEPLLTTRNAAGEIEGVKYAQITTILVNAVNEQQATIEKQQQIIDQQQLQIDELKQRQLAIDELKQIVCGLSKDAADCKK